MHERSEKGEDVSRTNHQLISASSLPFFYSYVWLLLLVTCCCHCMVLREKRKAPVPVHSSHSKEYDEYSEEHSHSKEHSSHSKEHPPHSEEHSHSKEHSSHSHEASSSEENGTYNFFFCTFSVILQEMYRTTFPTFFH